MSRPNFSLETQSTGLVAGVDEAGCGPWAGPVVAGAVIFLLDQWSPDDFQDLNDSKKMTGKKRESWFEKLQEANGNTCYVGVGLASVEEIDRLNIRQAGMRAMERAVENLPYPPEKILVDGTVTPSFPCPFQKLIKGDQMSLSIAAASVIAKVTRDRLMKELAQAYPAYGWDRNAGYGTKGHQDALQKWGVTPHHRKSFAPIVKILAA